MSGAAAYLRALSVDEARAALLSCCGSTRWVEEMLAARPYAGDDGLFEAAEGGLGGTGRGGLARSVRQPSPDR